MWLSSLREFWLESSAGSPAPEIWSDGDESLHHHDANNPAESGTSPSPKGHLARASQPCEDRLAPDVGVAGPGMVKMAYTKLHQLLD